MLSPVGKLNAGRDDVFMIVAVHPGAETDLLEIVEAGGASGPVTRFIQRRQQHGREYGDDGDDDQKFDQSERFAHNNGYVKRNSIAARQKKRGRRRAADVNGLHGSAAAEAGSEEQVRRR